MLLMTRRTLRQQSRCNALLPPLLNIHCPYASFEDMKEAWGTTSCGGIWLDRVRESPMSRRLAAASIEAKKIADAAIAFLAPDGILHDHCKSDCGAP